MTKRHQALTDYRIWQRFLSPFHSAALLGHDQQVLAIKYSSLIDIATLPEAAQTAQKYLNPNDGDIVLLNDPFSGGTSLSHLTFIAGINFKKRGQGGADHLLAVRIPLKPRLGQFQSIEDEGLRIPPTPIIVDGELNTALFDILAVHPMAPMNIRMIVERNCQMIRDHIEQLRAQILDKGIYSVEREKLLLEESGKVIAKAVEEFPVGRTQNKYPLEDGSVISMETRHHHNRFEFDFSGTTKSDCFSLTDHATLSVCLGATLAYMEKELPLTSRIFDFFDVTAPADSLVNASYPTPLHYGMTDGFALLANAVTLQLEAINPESQVAASGVSQCAFDIQFENGPHFYETLAAGSGATLMSPGVPGLNIWQRSSLRPSVELIEGMYPLKVKSFSIRPNSGGAGDRAGGDGTMKSFEVLQSGKLRWMLSQTEHRPQGKAGGRDAQPAELYLRTADQKIKLSGSGYQDVQPGDVLIIHSPGGGGFGRPETDKDNF